MIGIGGGVALLIALGAGAALQSGMRPMALRVFKCLIDPKNAKALLNIGIVRAFGKQDPDVAAKAWQEVIAVAPDTDEARVANRALMALRARQ